MRPYWAIITDSFHAALSSRILWVAFVAIWLFLLALAPIGYHEDYTTTFRWFDLDNGTQMKAMLARGLIDPKEADTALGRIARVFPARVERQLRQVAKGEDVRIDKSALADALNEALDDESWYDAEAWRSTVRLRELRALDEIETGMLTEPERRRRARLRIEAALPGVFSVQSARSVMLSYAGFEFPAFFAIGKTQFIALVNQFVVPVIMDWLLGFALIFLGILVTASIIPDMLQPGSLHLLLSKPVSRTLLLLAKFVGGCTFVFLCVCQLVIGLYLIAGLRLDIWNTRILWCIPVAVFLFAVFFSVSMLAGLRWRSPTLSIGVTCMFGALVLVIGFVGGYFDGLVQRPDQIARLAIDGEDVVVACRGGGLKFFNRDTNQWDELIETDFRRRDLIVPPVRLTDSMFVSAQIRNGRFNLYGSGSLDALVLRQQDQYEPRPGMRLPNGTRRIYVWHDSILALNNAGIMAAPIETLVNSVADEPDDAQDNEEQDEQAHGKDGQTAEASDTELTANVATIGATAWISDLLRMQGGATEGFEDVLPEGLTLTDPVRLTLAPGVDSIIVYSRGRLLRLQDDASDSDTGRFLIAADRVLEDNDAAATVIAASGTTLLVSRQEERIRWIDARDLTTIVEFDIPDGDRLLAIEPIGQTERFALLTTDGRVWIVGREGDAIRSAALSFSEVTAIEFSEDKNQLVIAHHIDRLDFLGFEGATASEVARTIRPTLTGWRNVDRWVITPLRTLTPQTGELSETVAALVSGKQSLTMGGNNDDDPDVVRLRILRPVFSCGIFTVVMLAISCVYFNRRDF
ncbi:ABC transporter permease [Roseiconus lacunae]|uniref:ABC transporter permease n=1 Tax=Roseiconus lacunae TaxID=2605694 RepID=UPI001E40F622|nr:ABC transporter permease [Roseiconus lacunae]MCD0458805.1 ABC transporter permease [Roseiconus lacunae]